MTDLGRLTVSLTKHNAHKVALLLKRYPPDELLERLDEVRADRAQAYKNLSVGPDNKIPEVWSRAKALGADRIDALLMVAISLSHHNLIDALFASRKASGQIGRIERGGVLRGKAYTNFSRVANQLGFARRRDANSLTVELGSMLADRALGLLAAEVIETKLVFAGWDKTNNLAEEVLKLKLNEIFGASPEAFTDWLNGASETTPSHQLLERDQDFFEALPTTTTSESFLFVPGHKILRTSSVQRAMPNLVRSEQLHNEIQNKLHLHLSELWGKDRVGTENPTGTGMFVDVVTVINNVTTFYEIKTASTVRAAIRQAIPQLLEYAYWPDETRADALVIVSHLPAEQDASTYLRCLSERHSIPISYRQFSLDEGVLK